MNKITVRLAHDELEKMTDHTVDIVTLMRCRQAGIPVKGDRFLSGVAHGRLDHELDLETGDIVLTWQDGLDGDRTQETI
jgi:hypothetical protein